MPLTSQLNLHSKKKSQKGFTMIEAMIGLGVLVVVLGASMTIAMQHMAFFKSNNIHTTMINVRQSILATVSEQGAWNATRQNNSVLSCLRNYPATCSAGQEADINLYASDGNLYVSSTDTTKGFSINGKRCDDYATNETCAFRVVVSWKNSCDSVESCKFPAEKISIRFYLKTKDGVTRTERYVAQTSLLSFNRQSFSVNDSPVAVCRSKGDMLFVGFAKSFTGPQSNNVVADADGCVPRTALKGPTGNKGALGDVGAQGYTGPTGARGPAGTLTFLPKPPPVIPSKPTSEGYCPAVPSYSWSSGIFNCSGDGPTSSVAPGNSYTITDAIGPETGSLSATCGADGGWQITSQTCSGSGGGGGGGNASCNVNGQVIPHGGSITMYAAPSVPSGQSCQPENRVCNNGSLSGSYGHTSCTVQAPSAFLASGSHCDIGGKWGWIGVHSVCPGGSGTVNANDIGGCPAGFSPYNVNGVVGCWIGNSNPARPASCTGNSKDECCLWMCANGARSVVRWQCYFQMTEAGQRQWGRCVTTNAVSGYDQSVTYAKSCAEVYGAENCDPDQEIPYAPYDGGGGG